MATQETITHIHGCPRPIENSAGRVEIRAFSGLDNVALTVRHNGSACGLSCDIRPRDRVDRSDLWGVACRKVAGVFNPQRPATAFSPAATALMLNWVDIIATGNDAFSKPARELDFLDEIEAATTTARFREMVGVYADWLEQEGEIERSREQRKRMRRAIYVISPFRRSEPPICRIEAGEGRPIESILTQLGIAATRCYGEWDYPRKVPLDQWAREAGLERFTIHKL